MIVLDVETTGTDAREHSLLSIGATDYDSDNEFYAECRMTMGRKIEPIALEINGFTREDIINPRKPTDVEIYLSLVKWAQDYALGNVLAGHNIGHLDLLFLEDVHSRANVNFKFPFSYRSVDLHSIAYGRFRESLNHDAICQKLGLPAEQKPHNALRGARSEKEAFKRLL